MTEEWRIVPSATQYQVSSLGRMKHIGSDRCRKVRRKHDGHMCVNIVKKGKRFNVLVHRLVAEAFLGPCPGGLQTRHLDGDPTNNRVSNLCYGTSKQNAEDKEIHGRTLRGDKHSSTKISDAAVEDIRKSYVRGSFDNSQSVLARRFGLSFSQVARIVRGELRARPAP